MKNKTHSEETKERMKLSASQRPLVKCPHCKKEGQISVMYRWHFDNCKNLINKNKTSKE